MDTELKILNIGYFYYHPAARNIASEHQLEKNGFTITDVKNSNTSRERLVSKNGERCIFKKYDGIWLCPLTDFFKSFSTSINASIERPVTRQFAKTQQTNASKSQATYRLLL